MLAHPGRQALPVLVDQVVCETPHRAVDARPLWDDRFNSIIQEKV